MRFFILFFKLVFALFLIQASELTASKYLSQSKSKEVLNRKAVRVSLTPGRSGSSRKPVGLQDSQGHRFTYAKQSAHLLPQGLEPSSCPGLCRGQRSTCCAGMGLSSSLQCTPTGWGWLWQRMEHSPGMTCSEGLWVFQGGAQGCADSATIAGGLSSVLLDLRFEIWTMESRECGLKQATLCCLLALRERQRLG